MNQPIPYFCQSCQQSTIEPNVNSTTKSIKPIHSINYLWNLWNQQSIKIPNTKITLMGFSVAALKTNFYLKELNIMFDGGLSSNFEPSHVFVTHLHTDHIANCPWHFDPCDQKNIKFYIPHNTKSRFTKFIESSHPYKGQNTEIGQPSEIDHAYHVIEVENGKNFELEIKGSNYTIEIIRCYHSVMCTSYGLIENKQKLKKEYMGLKNEDIKKLKFDNVEITENISNPFFLYVGDTSKEILLDERLQKYSTIMIECTFLNDEEILRADETQHMHWKYLEEYVKTHNSITFILYHFSSRYKREYINDFFQKINLPNIIIWNSN